MRAAGADLLRTAQEAGSVRADIDGSDLFALVAALGWLGEQDPADDARPARLLDVVLAGLAPPQS